VHPERTRLISDSRRAALLATWLKLVTIALVIAAVLNAGCIVCALACCCEFMPASHQSPTHSDCHGSVHSTSTNLHWMGFDLEPTATMLVTHFLASTPNIQFHVIDLSIDSPPPEISLFV
jgi:hypothetical protein